MSFLANAFGAHNNFQAQGTEQANQNYNQAGAGLNTLAAQLQQQSQGGGPNLANQQLQNTTAQNVANQAALMAGQRGASANPALIARQAAMQGANIQQQAVGQAASNRLAEQLASQQQLGNVLGTQGSLGANVLNSNNQIGSQQAQQNAKANQGLVGGIANAGLGLLGLAEGGEAHKGPMDAWSQGSDWGFNFVTGKKPAQGPVDMSQKQMLPAQQIQPMQVQPMGMQQPQTMMAAKGGLAQLPFSPHDYRSGGHVQAQAPQEKAVKSGNSYSNDKIPAMLSEGEVVIPRSVMQSSNPSQGAAQFVSQVMAGKHRKKR